MRTRVDGTPPSAAVAAPSPEGKARRRLHDLNDYLLVPSVPRYGISGPVPACPPSRGAPAGWTVSVHGRGAMLTLRCAPRWSRDGSVCASRPERTRRDARGPSSWATALRCLISPRADALRRRAQVDGPPSIATGYGTGGGPRGYHAVAGLWEGDLGYGLRRCSIVDGRVLLRMASQRRRSRHRSLKILQVCQVLMPTSRTLVRTQSLQPNKR